MRRNYGDSGIRGLTARLPAVVRRLEAHQLAFFLALFLLACGVLAFIGLARETNRAEVRAFDRAALLWFRDPGDSSVTAGSPFVVRAARDVTSLGGETVLTLFVLAVSGLLVLRKQYGLFVLLAAATLGGLILTHELKNLFLRVRPDIVPHLMEEFTPSFPSGHSAMSAVVYLTAGSILASSQGRRRLRIYIFSVAVCISFLVGVSRIILGVHYPTDVLAGWSLGLAWASVCWLAAFIVRYGRRLLPRSGGTRTAGDSGPAGEV